MSTDESGSPSFSRAELEATFAAVTAEVTADSDKCGPTEPREPKREDSEKMSGVI